MRPVFPPNHSLYQLDLVKQYTLEKTKEVITNYGVPGKTRNAQTYTRTETKVGTNVPRYRELIRLKQDASSYFYHRFSRITKDDPIRLETRLVFDNGLIGPQYLIQVLQGSLGYSNAFSVDNPSQFDIVPATIDALAYGKMISKARSLITPFEGMVFLGQLGKTLHQIRHPAQTLRKGVREFIRLSKKRAKQETRHSFKKVLADTWLEANYGWAPLFSDIKGGNEALKDLIARPAIETRMAKGYAEKMYFTTSFDGDYDVLGDNVVGITVNTDYWISMLYRAEIVLTCPSTLTMNNATLGFDPANIVPTVWELVPWSFLIDYFTNVGEVLNAWSFPDWRIRWINRSFKESHKRRIVSKLSHVDASNRYYNPGRFESEWNSIERSVHLPVQTPRFALKTRWPTSIKWLDIAGLIVARNSGPSFRGR